MNKYMVKYGAVGLCAAAVLFAAQNAQALSFSELQQSTSAKVLGETAASFYPYPTGSLVNDSGTIYFISGTTKVPFTNAEAFRGLGYSSKNVVEGDLTNYTPAESYTINTANTIHPWGSWLIYKGTVYYSSPEGLIGVPNGQIFVSNNGNWTNIVKANQYDIAVLNAHSNLPVLTNSDSRVYAQPTYQFGNTPSDTTGGTGQQGNAAGPGSGGGGGHASGALVNDNGTIYLIVPNGKLGIPNIDTFTSWNYSFSQAVEANQADRSLPTVGVVSPKQPGQTSPPVPVPNPQPTPNSPVISGVSGPTSLNVGQMGTWSVKASDAAGRTLSYSVDWGDTASILPGAPSANSAPSLQTSTFTHSYSSAGNYTVNFKVANDLGGVAYTSITVNVAGATTSDGYIYIEPSSINVKVGEQQSIKAYYQPPMPKCQSGTPCPQVMPAAILVQVNWSVADNSIASVQTVVTDCAAGSACPLSSFSFVQGLKAGVTTLKASYTISPDGHTLTATAPVTVGDGDVSRKLRDAKRVADVRQIMTALELFYNDNIRYPTVSGSGQSAMPSLTDGQPALNTYLLSYPSYPTPTNDGPCATGLGYAYSSIPPSPGALGSYSLTFCLGGPVGGLSAGYHTGSDAGIDVVHVVKFSVGKLVQRESTVYLVGDNGRIGIPNIAIFNSWCFSFLDVVPATDAEWALPLTGILETRAEGQSRPRGVSVLKVSTCTQQKPAISVLSPNGGETWTKGTTQTIKWQDNTPVPLCPAGGTGAATCVPPAPKSYEIKLATYYPPCTGSVCPAYPYIAPYTIAKNFNAFSYSWSVGKIVDIYGAGGTATDGSYKVQICQTDSTVCGSSDAPFSIIAAPTQQPSITALVPTSGPRRTTVVISGRNFAPTGNNINFQDLFGPFAFSRQEGSSDGTTIRFNVDSSGGAPPSTYAVTVSNQYGTSNAVNFTVTPAQPGSIRVVVPNGGETWKAGETHRIIWTSSDVTSVKIYISDSNIFGSGSTAYLTPNNTAVSGGIGYYDWTVPVLSQLPGGSGSNNYKIRIDDTSNSSVNDASDAPFSIVATPTQQSPLVSISSPTAGAVWQGGQAYTVTWSTQNATSDMWVGVVEVTKDSDPFIHSDIVTRFSKNPASGSAPWQVPAQFGSGSDYHVRVVLNSGDSNIATGVSPAFTISSQAVSRPKLSFAISSASPAAQQVAPGSTSVLFTKIIITAGNGDASLSAVSVGSDAPNGQTNLSNIKVYDGATLLGSAPALFNVGYYSQQRWTSVNFPSLTISNNTTKVLSLMADIAPSATGSTKLGIVGLGFGNTGPADTDLPDFFFGNAVTIQR